MIKLTDILAEILLEKKLCKKGEAYRQRRMKPKSKGGGGEKSSAYLSGRAVKVCKGLMSENEETSYDAAYDKHIDMLKTFVEQVLDMPYNKAQVNVGQSDGEDENIIYISSKIYSENPILFTTYHRDDNGDLLDYEYNSFKPLNASPEKVKSMLNKIKLKKLGLNEEIDPSEAYSDIDALKTVVDGKRKVAFIVRESNTPKNWQLIQDVIKETGLKYVYVKGNPHDAYIVYRPEGERDAMELKKLAEKYGGYLAANATAEDTRRIGQLLGYKQDKIEQYIKDRNLDEARIAPSSTQSSPQILVIKERIRCIEKFKKKFNVNSDSIKTLDLKIGKYNLSGDEKGIKISWEEGKDKLNIITRNNAEKLFNSLNITPTDIYIGIVPKRCAYSYYIVGTYNNNPIVIARKETESFAAGQTYLVTPNIKKQLSKFGGESFPTNSLEESLDDWFKEEKWVRIDTQGNITGPCGTMKKGKATTRCLPRAKANRLTKAERAATARKKVAGSKKGKQFVPNTPKAKVKFNK